MLGYEAYEIKVKKYIQSIPLFIYLFIIIETFSQYLGKHIQQKIQVNECKFSESYETIQ